MIRKLHLKDFFIGALLSTLLLLPWANLLEARPYTKVEVVSVTVEDDHILVIANFRKNECVFKRLEVFGEDLGQTYRLQWSNAGVAIEEDLGPNYDRLAGDQTLRLRVQTDGQPYDRIEIRTRHECDGVIVDKVFKVIEVIK